MTIAPTPLPRVKVPRRHISPFTAGILTLIALGFAVLVVRDLSEGSGHSSTLEGSGVAATQIRTLPHFGGIELTGSNNVVVRADPHQAVVVHADDNLLSHVTTEVHAGRLVIGNTSGSFSTKAPMSVVVTVRSLTDVTLTGSGTISATGIDAAALTVTLAGSGVLRLSGAARSLDVTVVGSGDAQLEGLRAESVHAVVAGSGRILVTATKSLDASVPGTGAILYRGNPPSVSTNVTGVGAVTPA